MKGDFSKTARDGSITILVLGDEGVGKSSLISTFVSRHFSERVPGLMTRVRLPANHLSLDVSTGSGNHNSGGSQSSSAFPYITTIVDTQNNGVEFLQDAPPVVDAMVLVYDLDRPSTFQRLESYWLPWIERCFSPPPATSETPDSISGPDDVIDYNKIPPVILAGNKLDLTLAASTPPTPEDARANRQQIVALLQRFKFVRHCIKTSAKTLLNVNDIFGKAQQVVLYPIWPLYDLTEGSMTEVARRAFTRIFRIFDKDRDGLLSDLELCSFQTRFFKHPILDKHVAGWKKILSKSRPQHADEYITDNKFTVAGFLAMIEMFMLKDFWEVPWTILRRFGYDDNLELQVPEWVTDRKEWKFSVEAHTFLTHLFTQFDSNNDGMLSEDDIKHIFSIVPPPSLPLWHPSRLQDVFKDTFSSPLLDWYNIPLPSPFSSINDLSINTDDEDAGVTILSSHEAESSMPEHTIQSEVSSPTLNTFSIPPSTNLLHPQLSLIEWTTYWLMVSSISPSKANMELYRLGFDGRCGSNQPSSDLTAIRVNIFGNNKSGKLAFLNTLIGSRKNPCDTDTTETPQTRCTHICIPRTRLGSIQVSGNKSSNKVAEDDVLVHIILTEVPETSVTSISNDTITDCELAVMTFNYKDEDSYKYIKELESARLTEDTPRVYIGIVSDLCSETEGKKSEHDFEKGDERKNVDFIKTSESALIFEQAREHCKQLDLEAPILASSIDCNPTIGRKTLEHLALSALGVLRSRPFAARKRQEALWRKRMIWFGSFSAIGLIGGFAASRYSWPWSSSDNNIVGQWIRSCIDVLLGHRGKASDNSISRHKKI